MRCYDSEFHMWDYFYLLKEEVCKFGSVVPSSQHKSKTNKLVNTKSFIYLNTRSLQ